MHLLLYLYPRAWRSRYGDEFVALLEQQPLTLRNVLDICGGALDAHLIQNVPGEETLMSQISQRIQPVTAVLILCIMGLTLTGFLFVREAPARTSQALDAIRVGVDDPVVCNDPSSCMASPTLGQVRIPGHQLACQPGESPQKLNCQLTIANKPLNVAVEFQDTKHTRILGCLTATYNDAPIPCQAIYHYPVSEIAVGSLPTINKADIQQLRWRYPLSQLSSYHWWKITFGVSLLIATVIGCGCWLSTRRLPRLGRIGLTVSGSLVGVFFGVITLVVVIINLHFPID